MEKKDRNREEMLERNGTEQDHKSEFSVCSKVCVVWHQRRTRIRNEEDEQDEKKKRSRSRKNNIWGDLKLKYLKALLHCVL